MRRSRSLRRVGCNTGAADGNWNTAAQKSLELFNRNAKTKFDVKLASADALDAVKSKTARVCPLICEQGYKADGEKCSRIVCRAGYEVGDDNTCEKIEVKKPAPPVAKKDEPAPTTPSEKPADKPGAKNIEALYAQCRKKLQGTGTDSRLPSGTIPFVLLENCVRNGG